LEISGFFGAKDDGSGDDNWSYKTCKASVKLSPPANLYPAVYRPDALPVIQPTVLKALKGKISHDSMDLLAPNSPGGFSNFFCDR